MEYLAFMVTLDGTVGLYDTGEHASPSPFWYPLEGIILTP